MIRDFLHARRYLAPGLDSFWRWGDGGDVLTWQSGPTIAFRAEIVEVLRPLASRGFPHFDAVVLFLAACRAIDKIGEPEIERMKILPSLTERERNNWRYRDLLVALEAVAAVPRLVRGTLEGKKGLAGMLFETAYIAEPAESAAVILRVLERGLPREMYGARHSRSMNEPDMLAKLALLAAGAHRIAADRLELRQETGLEQLPEPAPVDDSPPESLCELLERLKTDEELGGLARLARTLLAALALPRPVSEPQDLPLGGVSDIANRGSFDRLLLSELAHDDLTFTVRVALNQALYLRREAPPHVPPQRRLVLIDSGLRMWGLPRVFGTAAALALAVARDPHSETRVYRPRGPHLDVVNVATRAGLVSHLAALEPEAHPGESLPVFRRLIVEDDEASEAVLITCNEVLEDKAFQRQLAECELPMLYVVAVSRDGRLRLARRGAQGTKILRELKCPLEDILAPRPGVTPLRDAKYDPALPAILRMQPFPLRLSHAMDPHRLWGDTESGSLYLTTDRRLMFWDKRGQGARQLSDTLPHGKLLWHDSGPAGQTMTTAVIGRLPQGELHVLHIDRQAGVCLTHSIGLSQARQSHLKGVAAHAGALFVIFADHVQVYSLGDGRWNETRELPTNMWWLRDRFFHSPTGWYALSFNGTTAQFELVCDKSAGNAQLLISLFDAVGIDGPVAVTAKGEIGPLEPHAAAPGQGRQAGPIRYLNKDRLPPGGPFRVAAISADGMRIVVAPVLNTGDGSGPSSNDSLRSRASSWLSVSSRAKNHASLIDLRAVDPVRVNGDPTTALVSDLLATISNRTLRHKFAVIFVEGRDLVLVTHRGHFCKIAWDPTYHGIRLQQAAQAPTEYGGKRFRFSKSPSPPGTGYRLSVAQWDDGSRAYLDSRGLLHLKSSDRSIPELTLVLYDGTLAGWCANGMLFGPSYFTAGAGADDFEQRIRALASVNKIEAIKLYREQKGVGLKEAKEAVELFDPEEAGRANAAVIYNEVLSRFVMCLR